MNTQLKAPLSEPAHSESSAFDSLVEKTSAVFSPSTRVADCVAALRGQVKTEFITYSYVIDEQRRLVGVVTMRELLFSKGDSALSSIMVTNPFYLTLGTSLTDAMRQVLQMHFPAYPVCDREGKFFGIVRGATLFAAQVVELSAQPGTMVGVEKEERLGTPVRKSFRFRHPWLQLNLLTAFIAGAVVSAFDGTINRIVILAAFLPVLAGQSGNTGCQALAVTLRGITLGDYEPHLVGKLLRKEALLGLSNGFFVGLVAASGMYFMAVTHGNPAALTLSLVVLAAMTVSCMISGLSGVLVPLALKRFGFDPATASSIFLTTATDVASMGLLLSLASAFV